MNRSRHRPRRELVFVAVVALVALAAWLGGVVGPSRGGDRVRAQETDTGSPAEGWRTLEYDGVRLDVPETWRRLGAAGCEGDLETWGPPDARACGFGEGVSFPEPTTFDTLHEPGVVAAGLGEDGPAWAGYVHVGRVVVSVSADDRGVVRAVLDSVDGGFQPIG